MTKETKEKASSLEAALLAINKNFGKGSIMLASQTGLDSLPGIEWIPTNILSIDWALGGGLPRGRIVEIFGPESAGKSTLALHMVSAAQQQGLRAAYVDAEHALDLTYAANLGVNINELLISQPDDGEQALGIVDLLVSSNEVGIIIVDSVAALVPRAELEGNVGDSHMGLQARMMSQAMRMLTAKIATSKTTVVMLNQLRSKIGVVYGNPEVTSGGNALKFFASQRLDIRKTAAIKDGEEVTANRTRLKIIKNKVAMPFKVVEFDIKFGKGIDKLGDIFDLAVDKNIIERSGTWYSYVGQSLGQGKENCLQAMAKDQAFTNEITDLVKLSFKKG